MLQYTCVGPDNLKVKSHLRGVVATSPLIRQTHPEASLKLAAGHLGAGVLPWIMIPAPVKAKVNSSPFLFLLTLKRPRTSAAMKKYKKHIWQILWLFKRPRSVVSMAC